MAKKLWGGRFSKKTNPIVEEFTKSIDYDYKLAIYDVYGSIIHVEVLKRSGFLTPSEAKALTNALMGIYNEIKNGKFKFNQKCEDIHTNIQDEVEKKVAELALKLHTARSRNDQVLFSLKMFCQGQLIEISKLCADLEMILEEMSNEYSDIVIPGYTHMQHAQLIYLSDYLKSYSEMLKRDGERLGNVEKSIKLTLGAGAFAGTPIKPELYNECVKKFLKEKKILPAAFHAKAIVSTPKSLDTVSDRDFVIETLSALSILGMHLSRFAEDLIIWSTREFGFVEIDDAFATGSSLMPQKKNPDVLEIIRGYTGTLYGNLMSVLTMMKGLALTYNRDMQLDKPPLFSSFEIVKKELTVLAGLIKTLNWKEENIVKRIEEDETLYATDFVYHLIEKGIPFKKAHDIIGQLVKHSADNDLKIKDMTDGTLKQFSDKLKHADIVKLMNPAKSVESRVSVRG